MMTDDELLEGSLNGETIGDGSRQLAVLAQEVRDLRESFDLRWKAERRGIKCWQEATGQGERIWPDGANFTTWLLNRLAHADIVIRAARELGSIQLKRATDMDEGDVMAFHVVLHVTAYDKEYPTPMRDPDAKCCSLGKKTE